jgi:hypothetical protein
MFLFSMCEIDAKFVALIYLLGYGSSDQQKRNLSDPRGCGGKKGQKGTFLRWMSTQAISKSTAAFNWFGVSIGKVF